MTTRATWLGLLASALGASSATAAPKPVAKVAVAAAPAHDGAHAQVTYAGAIAGGHAKNTPASPEEDTAKEIEKLLRGPLRGGITGLFVADARTGDALFSVNPDDALNPASNVKMISTATALDLLGPDFRYATRVFGPTPDDAGILHGDVFLLGSYDPTRVLGDLDELAGQLAERGIHGIDGDIIIGSDPSRDGLYRATIPIAVTGGTPGGAAIATTGAGELVTCKVTATTARVAMHPRLTYKADTTTDATGHPHVTVTIAGAIGKGGESTYQLPTTERTAAAAFALRAALHAHGVQMAGTVKTEELGDFIGEAVGRGALPIELARHDSAELADIVAHVNKWSINWLADRVIMTASALHDRTRPSMEGAVAAMYGWLARHAHVAKDQLVVDTGSGLSYKTQITTHELVAIVRGAGGFSRGGDEAIAHAWLASLSVAGRDGTLTHRFRAPDVRGLLRGKTGTLSTAIALSGILEIDPARPLVFSIVTNTKQPLSARGVRQAHEQVVGVICKYLARTAKHAVSGASVPAPAPAVLALEPKVIHPPVPRDLEEAEPDDALDAETAASQ